MDIEEKRQDVHRALGRQGESPAWRNVQIGLIACLVAWLWLTFGFAIDAVNQGTTHPSLLSAPGLPNNARDPRYRPPKQGKKHPVEVGTGGLHKGPAAGERHRRLDDANPAIAEKVRALLPYLQDVAQFGDFATKAPAATDVLPALPGQQFHAVEWPHLFDPRVLVCRPSAAEGHHALAISRQGRIAALSINDEAATIATMGSYVLEGVAGHGPLVAAHWDSTGLLALTAKGVVIDCPGGIPSKDRWRCTVNVGAKLPLGIGGKAFAGHVAIARHPGKRSMRAAVLFAGESALTMFERPDSPSAPWLPTGGRRAHRNVAALSFTPSAEELLIAASDGSIRRMRTMDGRMSSTTSAVNSEGAWQAACGLANGNVARVALQPKGSSLKMEPMLFFGA
jgi:hypothetical protein